MKKLLGNKRRTPGSRRRGDVMIVLMVAAVALLAVLTVVSVLGFLSNNAGSGSSNLPDTSVVDQARADGEDALDGARTALDEAQAAYDAAMAARVALEESGQARLDTQLDRQGLEEELAGLPAGSDPGAIEGQLEKALAVEDVDLATEDDTILAYEAAVEEFWAALARAGGALDGAEAAAMDYESSVLEMQQSADARAAEGDDPDAGTPAAAPLGGGELLDEVDDLRARWMELSVLAETLPPSEELTPERIGRDRQDPVDPTLQTTVYLVVAATEQGEDGQWVVVGAEGDGFEVLSYDGETEPRSSREVAADAVAGIRERYPEHRVAQIELTNRAEPPRVQEGMALITLDERIGERLGSSPERS